MRYRQILTLMLGILFGAAAGAGAVYLFVWPDAATEGPEPFTEHGLPLFKLGPQTPELEERLRVLDQFAGSWELEMTALTAEGKPAGNPRRIEITAEWAVNKRFMLSRSRDDGGAEGLALRTYDLEKKEYPYWTFDWRGRLYQWRGRWDDKTSTMTSEKTTPEGNIERMTSTRSPDPNTIQVEFKSTSEQGKLISHAKGKLTRRTK